MRYKSTRGGVNGLSFTSSLLMGLASDGGLLVPETIPSVVDKLDEWASLPFVALAKEIIPLFVDDIPTEDLHQLIEKAYSTFSHEEVVALRQLDQLTVVELFHGPTLAFKDVALQLLGQLFNYVLSQRGEQLNILGATSGDTGSAAIEAVRGQPNVNIYILYPDQKVSALQEMQMTTVPESNVHCVAVKGSFDDCQTLMKQVFGDLDFKEKHSLGAVNSVNWARVMAQIVYYGYASLRQDQITNFCVPTGNFGNVFAAYLAKRMGFPIGKLLVATNANDILARFFNSGEYARAEVQYTLSPAMDIQIASNFERYLYYHFDEDPQQLKEFMLSFQESGRASLAEPPSKETFVAVAVDKSKTLEAIKHCYDNYGYVLDPHTAVGYGACQNAGGEQFMLMATAHPAKFPEAVGLAIEHRPTHPTLENLKDKQQRKQIIDADEAAVRGLLN